MLKVKNVFNEDITFNELLKKAGFCLVDAWNDKIWQYGKGINAPIFRLCGTVANDENRIEYLEIVRIA